MEEHLAGNRERASEWVSESVDRRRNRWAANAVGDEYWRITMQERHRLSPSSEPRWSTASESKNWGFPWLKSSISRLRLKGSLFLTESSTEVALTRSVWIQKEGGVGRSRRTWRTQTCVSPVVIWPCTPTTPQLTHWLCFPCTHQDSGLGKRKLDSKAQEWNRQYVDLLCMSTVYRNYSETSLLWILRGCHQKCSFNQNSLATAVTLKSPNTYCPEKNSCRNPKAPNLLVPNGYLENKLQGGIAAR